MRMKALERSSMARLVKDKKTMEFEGRRMPAKSVLTPWRMVAGVGESIHRMMAHL